MYQNMEKHFRAFLPFFVIAIAVFLTGCHSQEETTVYQLETQEDNSEILYIDDVQYRRDSGGTELAMYYSGGDVWTLSEGLGEQIGICGNGADSGGGFAIYEATGDEDRTVLYTEPRKFYFGGKDVRLWLREDVSLGLPTAEMVSHITITCAKRRTPKHKQKIRLWRKVCWTSIAAKAGSLWSFWRRMNNGSDIHSYYIIKTTRFFNTKLAEDILPIRTWLTAVMMHWNGLLCQKNGGTC